MIENRWLDNNQVTKKKNPNLYLIAITVLILLLTSAGLSFAYFTASLANNETTTTVTLKGGTLSIVYVGGSAISFTNVIPQDAPIVVKNFTLTGTNTTDLTMPYSLAIEVQTNSFTTATSITYTLLGTNTHNNGQLVPNQVSQKGIPIGPGTVPLGSAFFAKGTGVVHSYTLNIYFPNNPSAPQNYDQGKTFEAYVKTTEATATVNLLAQDFFVGLGTAPATTGMYPEVSGADTNYRYEGPNPNNYVRFNDELWRVIGVFGNSVHGQTGSLVKIIKDTDLGTARRWHSSNANNWAAPAELATYLNANTNGNYYFTLSQGAKDMIQSVTWRLGGIGTFGASVSRAQDLYAQEIGTTVPTSGATTYTANVGLMYPSDYALSVIATSCARTTRVDNAYNTSACQGSAWLKHPSAVEWTLTPSTGAATAGAHSIATSGALQKSANVQTTTAAVRPVVYLKSTVKVVFGTGTSADPYILEYVSP